MEENKIKALVMQAVGDTAMLLCQDGQILRVSNTAGWKVGEEVLCNITCIIDSKDAKNSRNNHILKNLIRLAACFIILLTGVLISRSIPIHTDQLYDCIEVKTNVYGTVIAAQAMNEEGSAILDMIKNGEIEDEFKTSSISDYENTIQEIRDYLERYRAESNLQAPDDSLDDNNDSQSNEPDIVFDSEDEAVNNDTSQDTEDMIDQVTTNDSEQSTPDNSQDASDQEVAEYQLASDLFGYQIVREEDYTFNNKGRFLTADVTKADDVYLPFYAIYMQNEKMQVSFEFTEEETIADFNEATVYLYDLTDGAEVYTSILDYQNGRYEEISNDTKAAYCSDIYLSSTGLESDHIYYVKFNDVYADEVEINNINYVFEYRLGGAVSFRYFGPRTTTVQNTDTTTTDNVVGSYKDTITFKDPAVEEIVRIALNKKTGPITKKDAVSYNGGMMLYRDDIETIEDLVWFTNINPLHVRADLIQDADILSSDISLFLFFDGLTKLSDIEKICNFDEINKFKWLTIIIGSDNNGIAYRLGEKDVYCEYSNNISDLSGIEVLLRFKNLRNLSLENNNLTDISDLECLSSIKSLEALLLGFNNIEDISALKNFKYIKSLYLECNSIEDISSLKELDNLGYLSLRANRIKDLNQLVGLDSLVTLEISENKINDLSPLTELEALSELQANHNEIEDVDCIADMPDLEYLELGWNAITDISGLKNLAGTAEIYLQNNLIVDWSPVAHIDKVYGRVEALRYQ